MTPSRRFALKRLLFLARGLAVLGLALLGLAVSGLASSPCSFTEAQSFTEGQNIQLTIPDAKDVTPGDFVTLVFRLKTTENSTVEARASSSLGWQVLRQPGTLELTANTPKTLAVTVSVPKDAGAGLVETLTLQVGNEVPANVTLRVKEQRDIALQIPADLVLGQEGLTVLLSNNGNVTDDLKLELQYGGAIAEVRELSLEPQREREERFTLTSEGLYLVILRNQHGLELSRAVNVIRYGVPEPKPFLLLGDARASFDTDLEWFTNLALGGSLSDDWVMDSYIELPRWRRTFVAADSRLWGVRLGEASRRPFRLLFPVPFGFSGRTSFENASLLASLGYVRSSDAGTEWGGYILPAIELNNARVSVGTGISSGQPVFGAAYEFKYPSQTELAIALSYLEGGFDALGEVRMLGLNDVTRAASSETNNPSSSNEASSDKTSSEDIDNVPSEETATPVRLSDELIGSIELNNLLKDNATFSVRGSYNFETFFAYLGTTLALSDAARSDWTLGMSDVIPADLPGDVSFGVGLGSFSSFAQVRYFANLPNGWQASNQFGVIYNNKGWGLTLDSHWTALQQNYLSIDGQFIFYVDSPLEGTLGTRIEIPFESIHAYGELEWDISEESIGLVSGLTFERDIFGLELSGDLNYNYSGTAAPFNAGLRLQGNYLFNLEVPEPLVESLGGRNLGRLNGSVRAGNIAVANVQLSIENQGQRVYKLLSDDTGNFSVDLPPGDYTLKLEESSLPITFRLLSTTEQSVALERQRTTAVFFEAVASAALSGKILEDANADGLADEPNKGVAAQLVLTDSEGLKRTVRSSDDGTFLVRSLLPGKARLKLTDLNLGSKVVGVDALELELKAGEVSKASFTVQPASANSQTFSSSDLRIRRVRVESDKVPAGTAPLVSVTVQGEAESMLLQGMSDTEALTLTFDGNAWTGRLPIPGTATPGVYSFTVFAEKDGKRSSKKGQVIIESEAPALTFEVSSPVAPSERVQLKLESYFAIADVIVNNDLGLTFETIKTSDNEHVLSAVIPKNTKDNVYTLSILVTSAEGQVFRQEATFRVLVP
ncbi:MAG: hypothetical protein ACRCYY_17075 [Trueperaceae bacterium]